MTKWNEQSVSCISSIHHFESHISFVNSFILPKSCMCNCVDQDVYFSSQIPKTHKAITHIHTLIFSKHFYNRNGPKANENSTFCIYIVATSLWFRKLCLPKEVSIMELLHEKINLYIQLYIIYIMWNPIRKQFLKIN